MNPFFILLFLVLLGAFVSYFKISRKIKINKLNKQKEYLLDVIRESFERIRNGEELLNNECADNSNENFCRDIKELISGYNSKIQDCRSQIFNIEFKIASMN